MSLSVAATRPGPIWRELRPADVATLANAAIGLAAIGAAWSGDVALAFHLVFLAIIVDGIDGAVARLGGGGGPLGHVIDTLADVVTFVATPAVILLMSFGISAWSIGGAMAFLAGGLLRLARFQNLPNGTAHFFGLSTPGAALLVGSIAILTADVHITAATAVVAAAAMLMRWPVPKLRGPIGVATALVITGNLVVHFAYPRFQEQSLIVQLAFLGLYLVAGPAYLKARHPVGAD